MIELERHIEILLLEHDCVIVPDLGGFMTHHCEARYDEDDHLFLPPQRTLGFNPQLKLNDSLLAQSYIEAYDISYPEAIRRIEAEVTELKQRLYDEGCYELNDIGRLTINEYGRMEFEPCEAGILTPELYGLNSFEMVPLADRYNHIDGKTEQTAASEGLDGAIHSAINIPIAWLRNAVAVAAAIIAFFVFTTPVSNNSQSQMNMSQVNLPLIMKETHVKTTDKLDSQTIRKAIDTVATPTAEPAQPASASYCIVLASQVTERNAMEFVEKLQARGIDARIHVSNNTRRVVCGNYETEAEARHALQDIHSEEGLAEAWIYKLKTTL